MVKESTVLSCLRGSVLSLFTFGFEKQAICSRSCPDRTVVVARFLQKHLVADTIPAVPPGFQPILQWEQPKWNDRKMLLPLEQEADLWVDIQS